jgi:thiol-disulfide isomerase/thioredoxin
MAIRRTQTLVLCSLLLTVAAVIPDLASAAERFRPFRLKTPDGAERALTDVRGKATLVVFFFPTCPFCNAALPEIQRLHEMYKDRGLSTVWINAVPQEDGLIREWQAKHGYTIPVLLGGRRVQNDYKLTVTPTYYLIDAEGNIVSRRAGYKPGDESDLERTIQAALGRTP